MLEKRFNFDVEESELSELDLFLCIRDLTVAVRAYQMECYMLGEHPVDLEMANEKLKQLLAETEKFGVVLVEKNDSSYLNWYRVFATKVLEDKIEKFCHFFNANEAEKESVVNNADEECPDYLIEKRQKKLY